MLVMTPSDHGGQGGHDAMLYIREYAGAGEVGYFASRTHGALWVGNVPSIDDTESTLRLHTRSLTDLGARPRQVDRHRRRGADRRRRRRSMPSCRAAAASRLAEVIDELRLVKDEWEIKRLQLRLRRHRARLRRRRARAAERPRPSRPPRRALARGHVLAARPAGGQRGRLHLDRRRRRARARRCTGGATTARSRPINCCSPTWASRPTSSTPPTSPARCRSPASGRRRPAPRLRRRARGADRRHRRGQGRRRLPTPRTGPRCGCSPTTCTTGA